MKIAPGFTRCSAIRHKLSLRVFASALLLTTFILSACSAQKSVETSPAALLPAEINYNNQLGGADFFWAADGCFYYEQDGFYNMGAYRSTGNAAKKLFESSDFASEEHGAGNLRGLYPYRGFLYFMARQEENLSVLYRWDSETGCCDPLFPVEPYARWLLCDGYLVTLAWSSGSKEGFFHSSIVSHDLQSGERTVICPDAEVIGLADGELRYICFDGEYELFRYDLAAGQAESLGRFPLLFEPDQYHYAYSTFNFTKDAVVMYSNNRRDSRELIVFRPSSGILKSYTMPFEIHRLAAAGNSAYILLYDAEEFSSASTKNEKNGLYRVNLIDGSLSFLKHKETLGSVSQLYVASEDCLLWVEGHIRILGFWRTVSFLSPETGKTLRTFHI